MSINQKEIQTPKTREYDLFDVIYSIWKEKTIIFLIVSFSFLSVFVSFKYFQKTKITYSVDYTLDKNHYSLLTNNAVNALSAINYKLEDFQDILEYKLNEEIALSKAMNDNLDIKKFVQFYKINELNNILEITKPYVDNTNYISRVSYTTNQYLNDINEQSILSPENFLVEIINEVASELNNEFTENLSNKIKSLDNQIKYFKDDVKFNIEREQQLILNKHNIKKVQLEQELDFWKNKLDYIKDKKIKEYQDALTIAYKLNITKPKFVEELNNVSSMIFTTRVEKQPLFFLGSDTLNIMINELKNKDLQYFDEIFESSNMKYVEIVNKINKLEYNMKQDLIILNLKMDVINNENIKLINDKKTEINRAIIEIDSLESNPFITISDRVNKKIEKNKNIRVYVLTILFAFASSCFILLVKNEIVTRNKNNILL